MNVELINKIQSEIKVGGDLKDLPCPFCLLPRCSRSDYIRCSKCGINWLEGDNLDENPKIARYDKMVNELKLKAAKK